jgi:hypothetical protein
MHTISFRLDPFSNTQSVIKISNIVTGFKSLLTASAGPGFTLYQGRNAMLDGSSSGDSSGSPVRFSWLQTSGPSATLSDSTAVKPTFVAPVPSISGQSFDFQLTVTNDNGTASHSTVSVKVAKMGDVNVNNSIDTIDLNLVLAARNTPASGPNDLRDVDGDGMITALDARKLTTLCTRPRCATQ